MSSFAVLPDVGPAATLALVVLALSAVPDQALARAQPGRVCACGLLCCNVQVRPYSKLAERYGAVLGAYLILYRPSQQRVTDKFYIVRLLCRTQHL